MKNKNAIVWLRNELRLHDNEPLVRATQKFEQVFVVYCLDKRMFEKTSLGFLKTDYFRAKFLLESLQDLRQNLRKIGGELIMRIGNPEEIIPQLVASFSVDAVYCGYEVTAEEINIEKKIEKALFANGVTLERFWGATLYHLDDLPFATTHIPDVYTEFRKNVEKGTKIRPTFPAPIKLSKPQNFNIGEIPTLKELGFEPLEADNRSVLAFEGGETAALKRLDDYLWKNDLLRVYKETRNGLLGADYSSKFSAWLALGCISPRKIYEEIKKYERQRIKNDSTYWLIFELIWRDYFRFVAKKYGAKIFSLEGTGKKLLPKFSENKTFFEKWANGQTGVPFIDANMIELNQTGFMSNRGRQNVASFLVKDMKISWIWGAMYFESKLIDYDVCSNWCNWNYVAGVGNDPREDRYFNILRQAKNYDAKGEYVKYWLPQLNMLPNTLIHTAGALSNAEQRQYDIKLGVDYPATIVGYERWAEKERY